MYARLVGRRRDKDGTPPVVEFLFDTDDSFTVETDYASLTVLGAVSKTMKVKSRQSIKPGDDFEKLAKAVGECIGKVLI